MPFTKYSLLDQSYLFHAISCHSSYKIPQRFDWCLQSNGRARAWIRPWSLPAWTVSRVGHKQFSTVPNKKLPSQGFVPPNGAAASMSCPPNDTWCERLFLAGNTAPNPSRRLESPFHLRTWSPHHGDLHRQSLQNVFQATRRFDASKQHRRSIRRFADHGSVQRPLLYGLETVRVPTGNAVQVIPTFFVGVSLPDIFFSRRSPLASAGGHGSNCDRTDVPCLEHDASHLTDSSLHSEPRERQQCKRNARTKLPPVATKNYGSLFQSTATARNDAFNHRCAKVQLLTYFQVGHWVASRNSMPWCCRTTAIPSAPPGHACQKLPYRHKMIPAILIHEFSLILYTNIKTDCPKKQLHTMMSRISHACAFSYGKSHRIHQISSVPWCRGWP